jgi:UPF0148 protein
LQEKKEKDTPIKRMADLLTQGATLTDLSCPVCSSPLFRLQDGTLWCAKDQKKVVIVKEGEEPPTPPKTSCGTSFDKLESTLHSKIDDLQIKIEKTQDVEELQKLSTALSQLLDSLDKIQKMKKHSRNI